MYGRIVIIQTTINQRVGEATNTKEYINILLQLYYLPSNIYKQHYNIQLPTCNASTYNICIHLPNLYLTVTLVVSSLLSSSEQMNRL